MVIERAEMPSIELFIRYKFVEQHDFDTNRIVIERSRNLDTPRPLPYRT
ncbi:unnamed protein product [Acanthoscelides obtectus]|uniref:Uncharacterized protein n=1 Tax=Acanthoscelides obtectus TaxID=200917 RepID=A0A9P0PGB3_ACAOB|nr:unnamed protein product [Acanthoscelides obtectus]CAK1650657.1 hypothetical protein AOBTE_LOCUS16851 [Acanthoscelides obtectus]